MNDYIFGNRILELRSKAGLSQAELAAEIGVTNKAVSKWEVGKAKPGLDKIRKLAAVVQISVEELLKAREGEKMVQITKIVITGGPCAGKSTAMSWVQNAFTQKGYKVLFIPETATELITGGVAPWTCGSNLDYQKCQVKAVEEYVEFYNDYRPHQRLGYLTPNKVEDEYYSQNKAMATSI